MPRAVPLVAVLALLVLPGCAGYADAPPDAEPTIKVPPLTAVSADVPAAKDVKIQRLAHDSGRRKAERLTVRIRNTTACERVVTGSGFALAPDVLITNRHVLAGADTLEVSTWDGHTLQTSSAKVGVLGDLGLVVVDGKLPQVGRYGAAPKAGEPVTVVGYPLGGPLTPSPGTIIDRVDGSELGIQGTVIRLTATVLPGNSGGPVLDSHGRIVGIVYAIERATGFGLAVPVDTLLRLIRAGGYEAIPACGTE
jgi:S1-C subfamily serine protease